MDSSSGTSNDIALITNKDVARSKFWSVASTSFNSFMQDASKLWKGPLAEREYAMEQAMVKRNCIPLFWGIGSALAVFVTFRVTGSQRYRQFLMRRRGQTILLEDPKKEGMSRLMSLPTDLMLSLVIGFSAMLFNIKPDQLQNDFEQAPLMEGKSLIAKHFCGDMTSLYRKIDKAVIEEGVQQQENTLEALSTFVSNCQLRDRKFHTIFAFFFLSTLLPGFD